MSIPRHQLTKSALYKHLYNSYSILIEGLRRTQIHLSVIEITSELLMINNQTAVQCYHKAKSIFPSCFITLYVSFPPGHMIFHPSMGSRVKQCVNQLPQLGLDATIQPITRTVLRVRLTIVPEFRWNDKVHGTAAEPFWIWVEDPDNNHIYHSEYFMIHKKHVSHGRGFLYKIGIFMKHHLLRCNHMTWSIHV